MKAAAMGLGLLACVSLLGCFQAEQREAREHEDFLKRTLGVVGQVGAAPKQAQAHAEVPGHAPAAN
jgi:hypothetical protein